MLGKIRRLILVAVGIIAFLLAFLNYLPVREDEVPSSQPDWTPPALMESGERFPIVFSDGSNGQCRFLKDGEELEDGEELHPFPRVAPGTSEEVTFVPIGCLFEEK